MRLVRAGLLVAGVAVSALVGGFAVFAVTVLDAAPPPDPHAAATNTKARAPRRRT